MTRQGIARIFPVAALTCTFAAASLVAQCPTSVVAAGLQAPTKIIAGTGDDFLIAGPASVQTWAGSPFSILELAR
jgi:hypothetical protein